MGGLEAVPYSIPWQVRLTTGCGGTLISPRHVMTAAHCPLPNTEVVVGEHFARNDSDGIIHETCRYKDHPLYKQITRTAYDFSILHLKTPVEFGPRAVPACLPTSRHGGDFLAGKILTTSGWGKTLNETHDRSKLRFVKVPGVTNAECQKLYSADPEYNRTIHAVELCAGDTDAGGIDACQGDSGGNI